MLLGFRSQRDPATVMNAAHYNSKYFHGKLFVRYFPDFGKGNSGNVLVFLAGRLAIKSLKLAPARNSQKSEEPVKHFARRGIINKRARKTT